MNQTISGVWLLLILVLILLILGGISYGLKRMMRGLNQTPSQNNALNNQAIPTNRAKAATNKMGDGVKPKAGLQRMASFARSAKSSAQSKSKGRAPDTASSINKELKRLERTVNKAFPEYNTALRQHRLLLQRHNKTLAILTVDKTLDIGRRHLGDVVVINFHAPPSITELKIELAGI